MRRLAFAGYKMNFEGCHGNQFAIIEFLFNFFEKKKHRNKGEYTHLPFSRTDNLNDADGLEIEVENCWLATK